MYGLHPLTTLPPPPLIYTAAVHWFSSCFYFEIADLSTSQFPHVTFLKSVSCSVMSDSLRPMACSPPGSSVHGILQARILEWVAMPFLRRSSQPRARTQVSPTLRVVSLPSEPPGKLHVTSLSSFKYVLGWKQASWLRGCRIPWEVLWRGSFRLRVSLGLPGDARLFQLTSLHFSTPKVCVLVTNERKQVGISLIMLVCHIFLPLSFENCLLLERFHCEAHILDLGLTCHIPAFAKSIQ